MLSCLSILLVLVSCQASSQQQVYAESGSVKVDYPLMAGRVEGERQQTLQPIRISLQYVEASIPAGLLALLQSNDGPIQSAVTYFQSFLLVNRFMMNLKAPPTCEVGSDVSVCPVNNLIPPMCGPHVQVPADHTGPRVICNRDMTQCEAQGNDGNGVANSDYVLYVTSQQDDTCNQSEPIVGYAGPCAYAANMNNQPYMGFINICPMALTRYTEKFVSVFVRHELTHALVFLDKLLNLFPDHTNPQVTSQVNGQAVKMITTPNVVAATREHFNCPDVSGAMIENEGGVLAQSNWESHLFFPELMNGILYEHLARYTVLSNITLSLFTDSGWYSVNYDVINTQLSWGSGLGCEFINEGCDNAYHCSPCCDDYIQCSSYDARTFGYCTRPPLHNDCPIVMPGLFCSNNDDAAQLADFIPQNTSIDGSKLVFNVQSICTEAGKPVDPFNVNCVGRTCAQINGIDAIALGFTINEVVQWCRRKDEFIFNNTIRCPALDTACAGATIVAVDPTDPVPPPLCDDTCLTCLRPQDPVACTSCEMSRILSGGISPSSCVRVNEPCTGNSYQSVGGVCVECPAGCSLCNGPQNTDCLACSDGAQFLDTTDRLDSPCVDSCPSNRGVAENIDQFGRRTCIEAPTTTDAAMTLTGATAFAHVICLLTLLLTTIY